MRTRHSKAWLIIPAIIISLVLLLMLALPRLLDLNRYRGSIQNLAAEHLGAQLRIGPLRWGITPNNSIWLEAETVSMTGDPLPGASLGVEKITVKLALSPLLQKRVVIKDILLESPELNIKKVDKTQPTSAESTKQESAATAQPFSVEVASLRIENGQLVFSDTRSGERLPDLHLDAIEVTITQAQPGARARFSLAVRQTSPGLEDGGRLSASGSLTGLTPAFSLEEPGLDVEANIDALAAEAIGPWLDSALAERIGGSISATVNYQGWPGGPGNVDGQLDLGQFSYYDPALWHHPVPGAGAKLQFKAQLAADSVRFDQLALAINDIKANAKLRLSNFKQLQVSNGSLNAEIPLKSAGPLLPWVKLAALEKQLKAILEEGGSLQLIDVQLPQIELAKQDIDRQALFDAITGSVRFSGLSARPLDSMPRIEKINGNLSVADGVLSGDDITANIGPLRLPVFRVNVHQLLGESKWAVKASGPVSLAASSTDGIQQLLKTYSLARLSTNALVDAELKYDKAKPDQWRAKGSLRIDDLQLTTLKNNQAELRGLVEFQQDKGLKLQLKGISGNINQAPVRVDGTIGRPNKKDLQLDLKLKTTDLELAHLADVVPALQAIAVNGSINTDMSILYDASRPNKTSLKGAFRGSKLGLQTEAFKIDQGDTQLQLAGKQVIIKKMALRLNQQAIAASGNLKLDPDLRGRLSLTSPDLNLDRLLAARSNPPPPVAPTTGAAPGESQAPARLPEFIQRATLVLHADVSKGVYRDLTFTGLKLYVDYDREVVKDHQLSFSIAGGTVKTSGRLELGDLSRIKFDTRHELARLRVEELLPVIVGRAASTSGPLSSSGHISGTTGKALLASLRGDFSLDAGPGRIARVGPVSKTFFSVLEFVNIQGIIKGSMGKNLAQKGIGFDSLTLAVRLDPKGAHIDRSVFITPAFNTTGQGLVRLTDQVMNMEVELAVFGSIDKALGLVPLVGSAASNITKVYLKIDGPLEKPRVRVLPARGVIDTVKEGIENPVKEIGRGLDSLRGMLDGKEKRPE
jgi:uncharacterized protein involved in outer membrane biogenesis